MSIEFEIKKGETSTNKYYFTYDNNGVSVEKLITSLRNVTVILKNANGHEKRIPINEGLPYTEIIGFGFIWFEFSPAITDAIILMEIE
ncbi:MAG: hypothetical protein WED10_09170 [Brumimicrobium sp.]